MQVFILLQTGQINGVFSSMEKLIDRLRLILTTDEFSATQDPECLAVDLEELKFDEVVALAEDGGVYIFNDSMLDDGNGYIHLLIETATVE